MKTASQQNELILRFRTYGNIKQAEAIRAWYDDSINEVDYGGAKGGAKSFTGCSLLISDALTYDGTFYFIARLKLNDLRKYTIPSMHEVFINWGITSDYYSFNGQDNYFTFHNGSRIYLLEARTLPTDPLFERFGSAQYTRGWIEEAGQIAREAIQNLTATVGRWQNDTYNLVPKILLTFNPTKGYLYKERYKPHKEGLLPSNIKFITALPTDNKKLSRGYIANLERTLSKSQKERLLKGNWEYDDDPSALIAYETIIDLFSNTWVPEGTGYISADIARYGKDKTVVAVWSGWRLVHLSVLYKSSVPECRDLIKQMQEKYKIANSHTIVDDDGVGGGVADLLRCKSFVNNSRPIKGENYDNLKSQCGYKLSDVINRRADKDGKQYEGMYVDIAEEHHEAFMEELGWLKEAHQEADKKKALVSKTIISEGKNLGRSPDYLDVCIMRAYFEVSDNRGFFVF